MFKAGTLVNFAMDLEEVYMTTKLAGDATFFLPFNMGNGEGVTAALHLSSNAIIASPFKKITTSIRSLSLAHTSSIAEKIFCPYFLVKSGLNVVAGFVYMSSSF